MRLLLMPVKWIGLQTMLVVLGVQSLAWNAVALLLYPLLPRPLGRRIGRSMIAFGYRNFWRLARLFGMMRLESEALDVLRDQPGLIVVANHPSMLDAMMLVARLPRSFCVMKASLLANPFLGPGARLARYVHNDTPAGLVKLAVRDLREGGQLVMFPEGTRTTQAPINPFRPGCTMIAKLAPAPIQTVFIDTENPYLGKGWPIWKLPPMPIVFSVRLGERFEPRQDHAALLRDLEAYFAAGVGHARPTP